MSSRFRKLDSVQMPWVRSGTVVGERCDCGHERKRDAVVTAVVRAEDLTKYYGSRRGLEGLTIQVDAGEVFGYLGPGRPPPSGFCSI
jgi:hypothetical protein